MAKNVAVQGEVSATAGSVFANEDANKSGSWIAGPVTDKFYDHLTIDGKPVIYESSCTFSYAGATTGNPPTAVPVQPETVTLKAGATVLQSGSNKVLLDKDETQSSFGNKLSTSAAGHVTSD